MEEQARLIRLYERGALSRHELLTRLCQAAAELSPFELAVELPIDILADIAERSALPPNSPDQCRVWGGGSVTGNWEQHFLLEAQRLYDGLWAWHRYFQRH